MTLPSSKASGGKVLCCHFNPTTQMQIVRIANLPHQYFERVVFPGQRLLFEALPHAQLEVHTGMMASAIHTDTYLCERLRVKEAISSIEAIA